MHTVWCDVLCCPDITIGCVGGRPTCTGSSSEPPPYGNGKTRPEMNVHFRDRAPHPRQRGHLPEMARPGRKCACISGAFPGGIDPENDPARSGNAVRKWPAMSCFRVFPAISGDLVHCAQRGGGRRRRRRRRLRRGAGRQCAARPCGTPGPVQPVCRPCRRRQRFVRMNSSDPTSKILILAGVALPIAPGYCTCLRGCQVWLIKIRDTCLWRLTLLAWAATWRVRASGLGSSV